MKVEQLTLHSRPPLSAHFSPDQLLLVTIGFFSYKSFGSVRFHRAFSDIGDAFPLYIPFWIAPFGQIADIPTKTFIIAEVMHGLGSYMSEKTIDETDIRIIRALQEDARKPFKEIAEHCDISTETVKKRFNEMEKNGVIRGTTIVVDPRKLDKKHIVILGIQTTQPYSNQVLNMVEKIPGICAATRAVGRYDVEAIAVKENIEQIGIMKDNIGDFKQVRNVEIDIFVDKPLLCPKNFEFD